ncbi:MAG TPA: glycoside hydrolase family 3 N-terminal domain-containing protein [Lentimicrobium sp.]|nr:glycoside hydrolase family 3 N-terminal domain-containing protein [Lentimicrobium sp.]
MKKLILLITLLNLILNSQNELLAQIYLDSTQSVETRVEDLLQQMTLDEKIGQMVQAERQAFSDINDIKSYFIGSMLSGGGSAPAPNTAIAWADMYDSFQQQAMATRLHIPLIYGVDAVHGHNNVKDAVIFPHNIGLGCTRNPELVKQAAQITAKEIMGTGLNWTFAPCIAVTRDERWGRTYEGFGETTDLVSMMGVASIKGFQGDSLSGKGSILACAKHYIGDGGTTNGDDQGNTQVDEETLRQLYLPAYIDAVNAGVGTVMASYSSWNGAKMHGHKYLLTDVLKSELGFDGFVVSDWAGIDQLPGDYAAKVEASVNAGIDMVMLPYNYKEFILTVKSLVSQNKISLSRIDDAVSRILRIKFRAGLFEHPYSDRTYTNQTGSDAHRQVGRQCVRESIVLLKKKDNILPLLKDGMKIHVAGKNADNMGNQCGGWSISWQGSSGNITSGTTVLEAIQNAVNTSAVTYSLDGSGVGNADIAIAVIGETPYAEGQGDRDDLGFAKEDIETVRRLKDAGIPVIVIVISGRPMILNPIIPFSDAILAAWLPGTEGSGIADILFGDFQPSGVLSNSWPADMASVPLNFGDSGYNPLFPYGFGISSLANLPAGSAPSLYSAIISEDGKHAELSFNKPMNDPSAGSGDFRVRINYLDVTPIAASIKTGDSSVIVLTLSNPVKKGNKIYVSYNGTSVRSNDDGILGAIDLYPVYNLLDDNMLHILPCIIEAENYKSMSGVQTENTTDTHGGLNVGWIDANDWMDYSISVPTSAVYRIDFRIAAQSEAGEFTLSVNDTLLASMTVPVTGGWQNWQSITTNAPIYKGNKTLHFAVKKGGFNLNWIELSVKQIIQDTVISTEYKNNLKQNFPNPFYPETTIEISVQSKEQVRLTLFDTFGNQVAILADEVMEPGEYSYKIDALSMGLRNGTYLCEMRAGDFREVRKLIVK